MFLCPIPVGTGFARFRAVDWMALLLIPDLGTALHRLVTDSRPLATQRFGVARVPLVRWRGATSGSL